MSPWATSTVVPDPLGTSVVSADAAYAVPLGIRGCRCQIRPISILDEDAVVDFGGGSARALLSQQAVDRTTTTTTTITTWMPLRHPVVGRGKNNNNRRNRLLVGAGRRRRRRRRRRCTGEVDESLGHYASSTGPPRNVCCVRGSGLRRASRGTKLTRSNTDDIDN